MSAAGPRPAPARLNRCPNWRIISLAIVGAVVAVLVAANAHLVYVATASQPDCVAHAKAPDRDGTTFRAARSSC